jgi:hypothetical protein
VTLADKSLLIGDEAADLLVEYAKLLGQEQSADTVELHAIGPDGAEVVAGFLLNGGLTVVTETTTSALTEPDNRKAEQYMHSQIVALRELRTASPEDIAGEQIWNADAAE